MPGRLIGLLALCSVTTMACGGGDEPPTDVAELFVELAADEGVEVDRRCVDEAVAGLSDADASLIIGSGESAAISERARAIIQETQKCVDVESYVDSIVSQQDGSIDIGCLRADLAGAATVGEINERIDDALAACAN